MREVVEPLQEVLVEIGVKGNFVGKEGTVYFRMLGCPLKLTPVIGRCYTTYQKRQHGQQGACTGGQTLPCKPIRRISGPGEAQPANRDTMTTKSHPAGFMQSRRHLGSKVVSPMIQYLTYPGNKTKLFIHNSIPFAFSAVASAWVAREQCVLTLPSEHPMAIAVSAISISSQ